MIDHDNSQAPPSIGPLVDDGAPFSAIGETELRMISSQLMFPSPPLEPKTKEIANYDL